MASIMTKPASDEYPWDNLIYLSAAFPENYGYSERDKSAINYHIAFAFKLCTLLEYMPFRDVTEPLTAVILFLRDQINASLRPVHKDCAMAITQLILLESIFSQVSKNPTKQGIREAAAYTDQMYDHVERTEEQVADGLFFHGKPMNYPQTDFNSQSSSQKLERLWLIPLLLQISSKRWFKWIPLQLN